MKSFTSKPRSAVSAIEFEMDGEQLLFYPPKTDSFTYLMLHSDESEAAQQRQVQEMLRWFGAGLNPEHEALPDNSYPGHQTLLDECPACRIEYRMRDLQDDLSVTVLLEIVRWLLEVATGNPTTSSNGYSKRRKPISSPLTAGAEATELTPSS